LASGYATLFHEHEQVMDPPVAYVMTHMLQEVCRMGTAAAASAMGRTVAGKTGTTNDSFDAWFMGYSPDIVTGVWMGYDNYDTPMDRYETGGHAALPIWMDYMSAALKGRPDHGFPEPPGVVWVQIDPKTGKRVASGGMLEAYKKGTEPAFDDPNKAPTSGDFMRSPDL